MYFFSGIAEGARLFSIDEKRMPSAKPLKKFGKSKLMNSVNLIPIRHRQQRVLRARRKGWIRVVTIYAIVLFAGYGTWRTLWGHDGRDLTRQLSLAHGDLDDQNKSIVRLRGSLNQTQLVLHANEAVSGQPDWSMLLVLIARLRGDEVVLNHCGLDAVQAPAQIVPAGGAETIATPLLKLQGYGKTQTAVSQFALRLEQTGLFESVALLKTNRENFLTGEAIAFRVECRLKFSATPSTPLKAKPSATARRTQGEPVAEILDPGDNAP